MNLFIKLLVLNIGLSVAYLVYLCALDLLFVYVMKEKISLLNKLPLLVVTMPFVAAFISIIQSSQLESTITRGIVIIGIFLIMSGLAFIELLWVSTHFHTMIGGKV